MISIIIPIYKVEKYLSQCIDSLISQTESDIEIILVDDGSPDACGEICDEYAKNDNRIVVIHQPNKGVSAARNAGLDIAKGEYIGFVDPDDWVAPEMFGEMLKVMSSNDVEFVICGYDYYDEAGYLDKKRRYVEKSNETISQKEILHRFADMPPSIRHGVCNKLFKKTLLHTQFKEGLHSSEDVLFLTEYVQNVRNAVVIHKPFYKNRVRDGSATHGELSVDSLADSLMVHDKMYEDSIKLYPELKSYCGAFLMDVCVLKYSMAERKLQSAPKDEQIILRKRMKAMKKHIRKRAWQNVFNKEIYWKTRISYLIK